MAEPRARRLTEVTEPCITLPPALTSGSVLAMIRNDKPAADGDGPDPGEHASAGNSGPDPTATLTSAARRDHRRSVASNTTATSGDDDSDESGARTLRGSVSSATTPTPAPPPHQSAAPPPTIAGRTPPATSRNQQPPPALTVETETVPSVPSLAVQTVPASSGSLRIKRSQDNVSKQSQRARKRPSRLAAGSRADMFAAKVASAMDEANSSDSDETFVYDANPVSQDTLRRSHLRATASTNLPSPRPHMSRTGSIGGFGSVSAPGSGPASIAGSSAPPSGPPSATGTASGPGSAMATPGMFAPSGYFPSQAGSGPSGSGPGPSGSSHGPGPGYNTGSYGANGSYANGSYGATGGGSGGSGPGGPGGPGSMPPPGRAPWRGPFVVSRSPSHSPTRERRPGAPSRTDSMRAKSIYLQRWRQAGSMDEDDDDEDDDLLSRDGHPKPASESTPLRSHRPASQRYLRTNGTYAQPSPHDYGPSHKTPPMYVRVTLWAMLLVMSVLAVGFIAGLFLASSRPLQNTHIARINDVMPSDKELVFSLVVGAQNPGYVSVQISRAELDVFATTTHLEQLGGGSSRARTLLLGTVTELDSPLLFSGTFFQKSNEWAATSAKLVGPCSNSTDNTPCEQWTNISTNPFELTVRGTFKYHLLFGGEIRTSVTASTAVEPPREPLLD